MTEPAVSIPGYVAGTWEIDPVHTEVSFVIRHMMVSKVRGRFDTFTGTIVTAAALRDSTASAAIDLGSINTGNETRDAHIRSADFFDTEHHPQMTFESTGVRVDGDDLVLEGNLTIRGVTRPIALAVQVNGVSPDVYGGTRIGFSASGQLNRHDFGVSYNGPIPGGGSVLGDHVTISIEVEAVLQS
jgi:polyisoprenoid-binding protein YceI